MQSGRKGKKDENVLLTLQLQLTFHTFYFATLKEDCQLSNKQLETYFSETQIICLSRNCKNKFKHFFRSIIFCCKK